MVVRGSSQEVIISDDSSASTRWPFVTVVGAHDVSAVFVATHFDVGKVFMAVDFAAHSFTRDNLEISCICRHFTNCKFVTAIYGTGK